MQSGLGQSAISLMSQAGRTVAVIVPYFLAHNRASASSSTKLAHPRREVPFITVEGKCKMTDNQIKFREAALNRARQN